MPWVCCAAYTETAGFSHDGFRLEVQPLHGTAGKPAFGFEPIENQRLVTAKHPSNLLHRFQTRLQGSGHPVLVKFPREVGALVVPESLEVFAQKVALDQGQIELAQLVQPGGLSRG
jgi:hypothetical protein